MRPPEVFVRELSPEEGARLKSISKRAKYQSKRQRAVILLASVTGMSAPQIAAIGRARPDTLGVALTRWSLAKLRDHLAALGVVLCEEALRQTLRAAGLSHQRTRSWKWSPDPDFAPKAERVLSLYRAKPDDGVVVCFDEMGPIQLIPHHGSGWAPEKLPGRLRATYSKTLGVRYLFGAYDVHADRLHGRL